MVLSRFLCNMEQKSPLCNIDRSQECYLNHGRRSYSQGAQYDTAAGHRLAYIIAMGISGVSEEERCSQDCTNLDQEIIKIREHWKRDQIKTEKKMSKWAEKSQPNITNDKFLNGTATLLFSKVYFDIVFFSKPYTKAFIFCYYLVIAVLTESLVGCPMNLWIKKNIYPVWLQDPYKVVWSPRRISSTTLDDEIDTWFISRRNWHYLCKEVCCFNIPCQGQSHWLIFQWHPHTLNCLSIWCTWSLSPSLKLSVACPLGLHSGSWWETDTSLSVCTKQRARPSFVSQFSPVGQKSRVRSVRR